MKYSQEFIEKVQEANNLVDLIGQHTQLKPSGNGMMGRCPFPDHPEKTPSFSVSEVKQVYYCFGCHKKGNIFTFLKDFQGLSFVESLHFLAQRAGIAMPVESAAENDQSDVLRKRKQEILAVNKEATRFFQSNLKDLPDDHPVIKYIETRGLQASAIENFSIGYAGSEWEALVSHLLDSRLNLEVAEEARLIRKRREGKSGYYDLFRERLMFPILSPVGEPLAFGGRIILEGEPKYLNSPESPVFHKGKTLFGLYQTAKYIRSEDTVILVEGYMDLISLFQAGVRNVAATMGTALTPEHAKLIRRMTRNVVVLFDGDSAGREASERSLPILLSAGLYAKGLVLPDNMDPDDYVREFGPEPMKNAVAQAPDLFSLIVDRWLVGYRGEASEKIQWVDKIRPILACVEDSRLRELYFEEVALKLGVQFHWLNLALNHNRSRDGYTLKMNARGGPENVQPQGSGDFGGAGAGPRADSPLAGAAAEEEPPKILSLKSVDKAELNLLKLVLKSRANFEIGLHEKVEEHVTSKEVQTILTRANEVYGQDPNKFDRLTSLLISYVDQPELLFWNESHSLSDFDSEKEEKLIRDCIKRVRDNFLRNKAKVLAQGLKGSPESSTETLTKIMELQRHRHSMKK
jgi:DNA primase